MFLAEVYPIIIYTKLFVFAHLLIWC